MSAPSASPRARESRWHWLRETVRTGGPGQVIFAITNACNANCGFCNFALDRLPRAQWAFAPAADARRAIDLLHGLFIRYVIITGGEPLLHPDLDEVVAHASAQGMKVVLVTNGSRLSAARCKELAVAGLSSVVISVDAAEAAAHEANRQLPAVCDKIRRATPVLDELGIQTTASVTISRLVEDDAALVAFLRALGFRYVTFSYPLTDLPSSFLGYRESALVRFRPSELEARFGRVKALKRSVSVANPSASLDEMRRFVRGEPQRFECLGGYRYFYLDWNLQVWRCHHWDRPIGSVFDLEPSKYVRDGCTRCMIDCFRDASVMQHVAVNVSDAAHALRAGRFLRAADHLLRGSNVISLRATFETRRWIRGL
jgi:MoaA/NifB/PqqE/SkfB family radical SAM enzyme